MGKMTKIQRAEKKKRDLYNTQRPRRIPTVLSADEVTLLLSKFTTIQDYTFFVLLYSCGLNMSEALSLRVCDVEGKDREYKRIRIRNKTGLSCRFVPLPDRTYRLLQQYWKTHQDPLFIFHESVKIPSMHKSLKNAEKRAGLGGKKITRLTLLFSYTARLIEAGIDTYIVESYLGYEGRQYARYVMSRFYRQGDRNG